MAGNGMRVILLSAALAASACGAGRAQAASGPASETLDLLADAIRRGYGDMCDLEGGKADKGGYFRCVDVGPYRFSFGDRTVDGYVILRGAPPYRFMRAAEGEPGGYVVGGPWEADLDDKVSRWYADEVGGGRARREAEQGDEERARAARAAVESYGETPGSPAAQPPAQAPTSVQRNHPQAGYDGAQPAQAGYMPPYPPPNAAPPIPYATQGQTTSGHGPDAYPLSVPAEDGEIAAPPGGRLIAPGVVQYGLGRPPTR